MNIKLTQSANPVFAPFIDNLEVMGNMRRRDPAPAELWDWRQMAAWLLGGVAGKELLDLACGTAGEASYFAKSGARVTAIDISGITLAGLKDRAARDHLEVAALKVRVDPTSFEDASFDRIHGLGILHRVGAEAGLREAERLLRPGGLAVFREPLGDSRTIEAMKTWFMMKARFLGARGHVTDHERTLTWREIELAVREFSSATLYPYHLLYRFRQLFPRSMSKIIRRIDLGLLTFLPQLQHQAGGVVICLRKPALQYPSYS